MGNCLTAAPGFGTQSSRALAVAHVTPSYPPEVGGVEAHVGELAVGLARAGHSVTVFTRGRGTVREERDGVTIRRFATRSRHYAVMPRLWRDVRKRRQEFDVVHAHSYHGLPSLAAASVRPACFVFTPRFHGTGHSRLRQALHIPYRPIGRRIFSAAGAIICVSEAEAALVRQMFPEAADRISVISNGTRVSEIRATAPRLFDRTLVLASARLEKYKQIATTIDAVAELDPVYALGITGDGEDRERLEAQVRERAISDRVQFLGRLGHDEYVGWLRAADVFVSMSTREAQGIALLEAFAAGVPVTASDIPAHREIAANALESVTLVPAEATPTRPAAAISRVHDSHRPAEMFTPITWSEVVEATIRIYTAQLERVRRLQLKPARASS